MTSNRFKPILIFIFTLIILQANAQSRPIKVMESFEDGIPKKLTTKCGKLSIDTLRIKQGTKSLRWDWKGNDALIFNTQIGYHQQRDLSKIPLEGTDKYLLDAHSSFDNKVVLEKPRGFFMWIYNVKPSKSRLTCQFGRDEKVDCQFDVELNFKGWRTVSVIYDRGDMRGIPRPDMNRMTLLAPATSSGTFYIDAIGLSLPMNPRTVGPNQQLPYIKQHTRRVTQYEHRLYDCYKFRPSFPLKEMNSETELALNELNKKAEDFILPELMIRKLKGKSIESVVKHYNKFGIKRIGNAIYGRPLVKTNIYKEYFVELGKGDDVNDGCMLWRDDFNNILFDIASLYRTSDDESDKAKLEEMFINVFDYGIDQGFDVGAGLGWIHHYAYEIRKVGPAFFLMRNVLEKHNRLDKAIDIMRWFYAFGQVYREDLVYGVKGRKAADADDTQGLLLPRLYTALIMKNSPEKVRDLMHFSSYFSNVTTHYANALDEVFKPDGVTFHHAGHTLGYGVRAANGAVSVMYLLNHSPFQASDAAYKRMKKIVKTTFDCLFTDNYQSSRAFASIRFSNYILPKEYYSLPARLALSAANFDPEMAGLYKKILDTQSKISDEDKYWIKKIEEEGSYKEYNYTKMRILSYSCVATHRNNNEWMATVRGHSKYIYPYESWGPSYFAYPTFIAYGYLDISYPKDLDSTTPKEGLWQTGYDWHRWPGVTSVYLPYQQILTSPGQHKDEDGEYPFSDQGFVGGVESVEGNGIFVFPFKGHDMFGLQSFKGKKTYFFFDDMIVCLGSNIQSKIQDYPVETTILQNQINDNQLLTSKGVISDFPYQSIIDNTKPMWIIDSRNTGYYIPQVPENTKLLIQRTEQSNPDFQGKESVSGKFTTVLLNHGIAPENVNYEYAVLINADKKKMDSFTSAMKSKQKAYKVIQQNEKAHIVSSPIHSITSYAIFDSSVVFKKGIVKAVNRPSTFILKEEAQGIKLAVSDPDLNIYDGQDDLMPDGSRSEVSIYEHEWFYSPSRSSKVQITLKGEWKISKQIKEMETAKERKARIIYSNKKETLVEFECKDGLSAEVFLER